MNQHEAAQITIDAMESGGLLEDVDRALLESVLGLAAAVDSDPANASLWQQYRGAISDLRSLTDGGSDAFEDLISWLRSPSGDSPKARPGNVRGGDRPDR